MQLLLVSRNKYVLCVKKIAYIPMHNKLKEEDRDLFLNAWEEDILSAKPQLDTTHRL